jgi:hypothetical protein
MLKALLHSKVVIARLGLRRAHTRDVVTAHDDVLLSEARRPSCEDL